MHKLSLLILLASAFTAQAQLFSNVTFVKSNISGTPTAAVAYCASIFGTVATTRTQAFLDIVGTIASSEKLSYLSAQRDATNTWRWFPTISNNNTVAFSEGGNCRNSSICVWASGSPTPSVNCLALSSAFQWVSVDCASTLPYVCEVRYTVAYFCIDAQVPTDYNLAQAYCLAGFNGSLAAIPTTRAWTTIRASRTCLSLGTARIGADNYDLGAFTSAQPFNYRWKGVYLSQEDGGRGRLFSTGESPATQIGFQTLPWGANQPTGRNVVAVDLATQSLFSLSFRVSREAGTYFICEVPLPGQPRPSYVTPASPVTAAITTVSRTDAIVGVVIVSIALIVISVIVVIVYYKCRPGAVHSRSNSLTRHHSHHKRSSSDLKRKSSHRRSSRHR